jgi:transcriptional regulator with XRE-family HTH domain
MAGKRDLDPGASPLHFFGAEVRRAREAAGLTLAELGATVPCDASTVSRIESGLLSPTERFAEACDEAFPQMGGWFGRFYRASLRWDGRYPRWFEDWVDGEGRATVLRWWEALLVPGLLQTPEYARVLFRAWRTDDDQDRVEQLVLARMDRQRIFDRPAPPSFWAVLDEAVLRRRIGGAKVMQDQLFHLTDVGERANVNIHVIPAETAAHVGLLGAFAIAGFGGDAPGMVYFESPDEGLTTRDPGTVAKIGLTFEALRSEALPRGASRDLILKVAGEYGRDLAEVQLQRRQRWRLRRGRRAGRGRPRTGPRHHGPRGTCTAVHTDRMAAIRRPGEVRRQALMTSADPGRAAGPGDGGG